MADQPPNDGGIASDASSDVDQDTPGFVNTSIAEEDMVEVSLNTPSGAAASAQIDDSGGESSSVSNLKTQTSLGSLSLASFTASQSLQSPGSPSSPSNQVEASWYNSSNHSNGQQAQGGGWAKQLLMVQVFAVSVATVLGTGILGLPVTLADSGFAPFVTTYGFGLLAQGTIVVFMVELMQRAAAVSSSSDALNDATALMGPLTPTISHGNLPAAANAARNGSTYAKNQGHVAVPTRDLSLDEEGLEASTPTALLSQSEADDEGAVVAGSESPIVFGEDLTTTTNNAEDEEATSSLTSPGKHSSVGGGGGGHGKDHGPSLHSMALTFLPWAPVRAAFEASVFVHFISILITYVLAGAEAYGALFSIPYESLILPFWIICTATTLIGGSKLAPFISAVTFFKASLLIALVAVTGIVANRTTLTPETSWAAAGRPFLVGTVALGGAINTMPVLFAKASSIPGGMIAFRRAAVAAIFFVWALNVAWCYYILEIVPQHCDNDEPTSLAYAASRGEISTVPLIAIIHDSFPDLSWVAFVVDAFITVSITVSFITMGIGLKHTLDGYADSWSDMATSGRHSWMVALPTNRVWAISAGALYALCWGFVLIAAVTNPQGFLTVMERATSMALNVESGVCVVLMLEVARQGGYLDRHGERVWGVPPSIKYPISETVLALRWPTMAYFGIAIVYDLLLIAGELIGLVAQEVPEVCNGGAE